MKENITDIFSGVSEDLLNSTKEKFNKLSKVEKKNVLDDTNKLMDTFCDIFGVKNKYHLTEEMFDDVKEKCKETRENIKESIKNSKDSLSDIARDTLNKLGISDEFIKTCKVDDDKIYIDVQMPVDSYDNENTDNISNKHSTSEQHNVPKFTRKNKVKNKKIRVNNKITFKTNYPVVETEQIDDCTDMQSSLKTSNVLDRLKSEAKEKEVNVPKINLDDIKQVLIDKIEAIIEDDNTHAYTVYSRDGNIPASVHVILDDVCDCICEHLNILSDVSDAIKDKYGFPDVYTRLVKNNDTNDNTVSVEIACMLEK